jgi:hypothetical protein
MLSWPSLVHLAAVVVVPLSTLPVEKVRVFPSPLKLRYDLSEANLMWERQSRLARGKPRRET